LLQYQLALKLISGLPFRMPEMIVRCAATVPAPITPAAIWTSRRAVATSPLASIESRGSPIAWATTCSEGPKAWPRYCARASFACGIGGCPKPMIWNSRVGESREETSANSWIRRLSSRRWIDVSSSGSASVMKPGLMPVLWIELFPRRHASSTRDRTAGSRLSGL
jgi:hypothetical protein